METESLSLENFILLADGILKIEHKNRLAMEYKLNVTHNEYDTRGSILQIVIKWCVLEGSESPGPAMKSTRTNRFLFGIQIFKKFLFLSGFDCFE